METPDKIYIVDATFPDYVDFDGSPINTKRIDDHDIEYIRKDDFIEKACEWLSKSSNYNEGFIYPSHNGVIDAFVNNFKNYMKGE